MASMTLVIPAKQKQKQRILMTSMRLVIPTDPCKAGFLKNKNESRN